MSPHKTRKNTLPGYLTAEQAAKKLRYEYTYFTRMLNEDRVPGALHVSRRWWIPEGIRRRDLREPVKTD